MKYSQKLADKICEMLATGEHSLAAVCEAAGITKQTFYNWKETKLDFLDSLKRVEAERLAAFGRMARSGLAKLLDVHEVEETTTEYVDKGGKPVVKSKKVTKRIVMPSATAVIFTLKNLDSENFKDKQEVEHKGEVGVNWHETRTYEGGERA